MTELLQKVITELKKLPPDQQDAIASRLMAELKDKQLAERRPITTNKQLRPFGLCAGEFTVLEDFDAPLPEDILSAFEGK